MSNSKTERKFDVKKLQPFFIDEVANISINQNGACRLQFASWQTNEDGKPLRVDSEIILTLQTLRSLSEALPNAIDSALKEINERKKQRDLTE